MMLSDTQTNAHEAARQTLLPQKRAQLIDRENAADPSKKGILKARLGENVRTIGNVSRNLLANEGSLADTKWFDYRFMSPWEATETFARDYQNAFRNHWEVICSTEEAPKKVGIAKNGLSSARERTSLWTARQCVDALGLPYGYFLARAFELTARMGHKRPPRPNQLYGEKLFPAIAQFAQAQWAEFWEDRVLFSRHGGYLASTYCNLPPQDAHVAHVAAEIKRHGLRPHHIANAVLLDKVMSDERALQEFGAEKFERAMEEDPGGEGPVDPPELLLPSCFGLPGCQDREMCGVCRLKTLCTKVVLKIESEVLKQFKSADPSRDREKELGRRRVEKCRLKKKASEAKPLAGGIY